MPSSPARSRPYRSDSAETDLDRAATLQLIIALGRTLQVLEKGVKPHLATFELGITEFAVLEVLYHKGPLTLSEIRDRILVTGASTTYVVDKLVQRGLVKRRSSNEDKRIIFGELTAAGRALIAKVFPAHVQKLRALMAGLSRTEKRTASHLLRKLIQGATSADRH